MSQIINPYTQIINLSGTGLNDGNVYVGVAGQDPQTDPIPVFWDEGLTIPANQPLSVQGGYLMHLGTPSTAYAEASSYSIRVTDRHDVQVFYAQTVGQNNLFTDYDQIRALTTSAASPVFLNDGPRSGTFIYDADDTTSSDNGGTILVPDSGLTGRWKRVFNGPVQVDWFGAEGDNTTDDTPAFVAAIASLGSAGGVVATTDAKKYYLKTLVVPPGVTIQGSYVSPDSPTANSMLPFGDLGCLSLDATPVVSNLTVNGTTTATVASAAGIVVGMAVRGTNIQIGCYVADLVGATVTLSVAATGSGSVSAGFYPTLLLKSKSGLENCFVVRHGMTYPAPDGSAYVGVAITGIGDGPFARNCLVIGFGEAFSSNTAGRVVLDYFYWDCTAGVYMKNSLDSSIMDHYHAWPFGTIQAYIAAVVGGGTAAANAFRLHRAGYGVRLDANSDDTYLGAGLIYAYATNYLIDGPGVSISKAWSDSTGFYGGSVGFKLGPTVDAFQAAMIFSYGSEINFQASMSPNQVASIGTLLCVGATGQNVVLNGGDITISALCSLNGAGSAVFFDGGTVRAFIGSLTDRGNAGSTPISAAVPNLTPGQMMVERVLTDKGAGVPLFGTNTLALPSIPAADPLQIPLLQSTYIVTGAPSFSSIAGGSGNMEVDLIFASSGTIFSGGNVNIPTNLTITAGELVRLKYDVTLAKWRVLLTSP